MQELLDLWLPILVSAAVVFFAAFVLHVISPHHKGDYSKMPDEDAFLEAVRRGSPRPGYYIFPFCQNPAELKDPSVKARYDRGPHGFMSLWGSPPNMGANLIFSIIFYLVTSTFIAYLATIAFDPGEEYLNVFQITGTAGILAYCFGFVHLDIWFKRPGRNTMMDIFDGVIYALLTAGIFGWMWPAGT